MGGDAAMTSARIGSPAPSPFLYSVNFRRSHRSYAIPVIVALVCSLVALGLLLVGFYRCKRRNNAPRKKDGSFTKPISRNMSGLSSGACTPEDLRKTSSADRSNPPSPAIRVVTQKEAQVFTYKQLQFATNNFSPANVIGNGGFGLVYRSVLPDGRVVAIKQLDRDGKQGEHEFRVEVDLLSRLRSPYLLELIGYCADQDHRLLVYEYMSNGNLQEHLYSDGSPGNPPLLDWGTRMRIALDAAKGLEYLHEQIAPPVIHRDLKASNILLDENFNAKVSDFGLAKLGSDKLNGEISTRVLGTTGYVAPEYALTGHLTTKSDVYSFGVVLLELLTGRVPVDMKRPLGQGVLVSWALPYLTDREKVSEVVDPVLEGQYLKKDLIQIAAIAAICVQPEADYRPLMTDVVQSLIPLVRQHTVSRVTSSPNFRHQIVTVKSSSIDSGSSGTSLNSLNSPRILLG
uniref:Protein kinase domain-containing protein n=2 Tax=Araucaria cunninghamii TaxID=56994 RepID=A0A0D6R795_ARACU